MLLVTALMMFGVGYDIAITDCALNLAHNDANLSLVQVGVMMAVPLIFNMLGVCAAAAAADLWGRKLTCILGGLFLVLCSLGAAPSRSLLHIYVFRCVIAAAEGILFVNSSVHLAETVSSIQAPCLVRWLRISAKSWGC